MPVDSRFTEGYYLIPEFTKPGKAKDPKIEARRVSIRNTAYYSMRNRSVYLELGCWTTPYYLRQIYESLQPIRADAETLNDWVLKHKLAPPQTVELYISTLVGRDVHDRVILDVVRQLRDMVEIIRSNAKPNHYSDKLTEIRNMGMMLTEPHKHQLREVVKEIEEARENLGMLLRNPPPTSEVAREYQAEYKKNSKSILARLVSFPKLDYLTRRLEDTCSSVSVGAPGRENQRLRPI